MRARTIVGCLLCALLATLAVGAAPAQASRSLVKKTFFAPDPEKNIPPPEAQIEGACGLAVATNGSVYVSDYHHRVIDVFNSGGGYESQLAVPVKSPEGPCGLAFGPGGALYVNSWHESVLRLKPSLLTFDTNNSTGVAVDAAGNVYVDDRTYVAVYGPSGAPVLDGGGDPLKIGEGSLVDGFGLAVSSKGAKEGDAFAGGRIYVADAVNDRVKVYEPSVDPSKPAATIAGFNSLVDAALAVDPTNDNLLVVDNLQPGFEHPKAAVFEFSPSGAALGALPGAPIHGEPSGIAVNPSTGTLYVTDGNDEQSNVFEYGSYVAAPKGAGPTAEGPMQETGPLAGAAAPLAGAAQPATGDRRSSTHRRGRHRGKRRGGARIAIWDRVMARGRG